MGFNYGKERNQLDREWKQLRVEYREAGMPEDAIDAMYQYDREWLNSCRRYMTHTIQIADVRLASANDETTFSKFDDVFAWIYTIKNEKLVEKLVKLSVADKWLLTLVVNFGFTQREIAALYGCSQAAISQKMKKFKKFLG